MEFDKYFKGDFGKKRKRPSYTKPSFWIRCLDCRAIYSDRVYRDYPDCKFCGGSNWSDDL